MKLSLSKERNVIYLCMYMLLCCTLTACNETEPAFMNDEETPVQIGADISLLSRATEAGFELNDTLGIYITKWEDGNTPASLLPTANYKDNAGFRLVGLPNEWVSANTVYYPSDDSKIDLYAYYPYRTPALTDGTVLNLAVAADQSSYRDYTFSDFMSARTNGVKRSAKKVQLTFSHKLSQMVFQLKPGAGFSANELLAARVKIVNAVTDAVYDLSKDSVSAGSTRKDILPYNSWTLSGDSLNGVMAIVVPQEINQATFIQVSLGNRIFTFKPQSILMKSGCSRKFTITVNNTGLDITTSITPWNNCPPVNGEANEDFNNLETIFGPLSERISGEKVYNLSQEFVLAPGHPFKVSGTMVWNSISYDTGNAVEVGDPQGHGYIYITANNSEKNVQVHIKNFSDRSKDVIVKVPRETLLGVSCHIVIDYDGSQLTISLNGDTIYQGTPEIDTANLPLVWLAGSLLNSNGDCNVTFSNFTIEN